MNSEGKGGGEWVRGRRVTVRGVYGEKRAGGKETGECTAGARQAKGAIFFTL